MMYSMPNFDKTGIKLRILSNQMIDEIIEGLNTKEKNATGSLARSLKTVSSTSGGFIRVEFKANNYWKYVNDGRKKGTLPNIGAIEKWAKVKLGLDSDDAKRAAFGIAKNIKKKGIKPTNIFTDAINNFNKRIAKVFVNEMNQDISASIREALNSK